MTTRSCGCGRARNMFGMLSSSSQRVVNGRCKRALSLVSGPRRIARRDEAQADFASSAPAAACDLLSATVNRLFMQK